MKIKPSPKLKIFLLLLPPLLVVLVLGFLAVRKEKTMTMEILPNLVMTGVDGKEIKLSQLKGEIFILNFWAHWCPPCLQEIPSLVRLQRDYANKGLMVLGIHVDKAPTGDILKLSRKYHLNYPLFSDANRELFDFLQLETLPTTIVINRERKILANFRGPEDWNSDRMRAIIDKKPPEDL